MFGNDILSICVYGSTLSEDFCDSSDIDMILVFDKELSLSSLGCLEKIKKEYQGMGYSLDLSPHTKKEMIGERKNLFWHNNRGVYIQKEMELYGQIVHGESFFDSTFYSRDDLKNECIKVIHSLKYNARKILLQEPLSFQQKKNIIKFCLYSVGYALAFMDIYPEKRALLFSKFDEIFNLNVKAVDLLQIKMNNYNIDDNEIIATAYDFLCEIENKILLINNK